MSGGKGVSHGLNRSTTLRPADYTQEPSILAGSSGSSSPDSMDEEQRSMQEGQKSANLARIRENQRRSRLRRKEYVQELEAKNRQYESEKMKATIEMQTIAKTVNDENRLLKSQNQILKEENAQLREVLSNMGITEVDLERRLNRSQLSSRRNSSTHILASPTFAQNIGRAGEQLNSMLLQQTPEDKPAQISYMSASRKLSTSEASDSMPSHPQPLMLPLSEGPPTYVTSLAGSSSGVAASYSLASSRPGGSLGLNAPGNVLPPEATPSSGKAPIPQEIYGMNPLYPTYQMVPQQNPWQGTPYNPLASSSQNPTPTASQAMSASMLAQQQELPENPYNMNEYYGRNPNPGNQPGN